MKQEPGIPAEIKAQNQVARRNQFFFLLKSRILGYHYTAFHITLFIFAALLLTGIIYLLAVRRKRKNYQYQ